MQQNMPICQDSSSDDLYIAAYIHQSQNNDWSRNDSNCSMFSMSSSTFPYLWRSARYRNL